MKRNFILGMTLQALTLTMGLTMSISTFAQTDSSENQALIEVVNDPAPAVTVQTQVALPAATVQAAPVQAAQSSPAVVEVRRENQYVLQNQPVINQQQPNIYVQKQNTTVVEDTPLTESAADKMRKQRMEMEQQTESKIVEKLEEARMKAEQVRATKLLTGLEDKQEEKKEDKKVEEVVVAAPVVAAPLAVQVIEPAPIAAPIIEVKAELSKLDEAPVENKRYYMTFDTGFIAYDAKNVDTGVGVGTNFGAIFDDRYIVEGNFLFTRANIESVTQPVAFTPSGIYPTIIQMDQYGFGGTFKYRILKTRISPYVGGSLAYTYRNYKNKQSPYGYATCPYYNCDLDASSWAVDMGLLAGADIALSNNFSIGSEFKYMFNAAYDVKTNGLQQSKLLYPDFYSQPVEELGYYSLTLSLKYMF